MTLKALSNLVLKFYSNGTIKSSNIQLSQAVIEGYLKNAYGYVIQSVIDKKKRNNELDMSYLMSGAIVNETFTVKKTGRKTRLDLTGKSILRMDNAMQIVGFELPVEECGCGNSVNNDLANISYVAPNEVKFYTGEGYEDLNFYALTGNGIDIYNLPECLEKIVLVYAKESSEIDIPADICLTICKVAFPDIFGVKKFGKEKVDDSANDVIEQLKLQINAGA